ncbi:RHS repeat domain-containing protein [Flavobacterium soli]|uniref:RHS repeat domain-containing protein n=1 Tax=Flavobacterium soli TaxID=344881 RepID=UPI0004055E03|nr:RHS repeat domain-containing protein [Flavobacterium soli]
MDIRTTFYSIALLVAGISSQQVTGQEVPKVIPPSPEAATILQHSPVNVSLYTGTPNISVPFHTISHGGVEVPISLSYSSDGIRVGNIASWAGLGWSLNAGGLISRTINKLPDDAPVGYMNTTFTIADLLSRDDDPMGTNAKQGQLFTILGYGALRDYEPDAFNFSFLGYSGQFQYKREGNESTIELIQTPLSNLRIETTQSSGVIIGFMITDEAGIKYYFGESKDGSRKGREYLRDAKTKSHVNESILTSSSPNSIGSFNCYQSWMLMDIVFPTRSEIIRFSYSTENNVGTYVLTGQETKKGYAVDCQEKSSNYLMKKFDQPKLKEIAFPFGKVIFEKETIGRLDLANSYALRRLMLIDTKKNNNDSIVKKMQLHTSYMVSAPEVLTQFFGDELEGRYRLRLDSLSLQGRATSIATQGRYVFKYNPIKLPNRYSNSIDYFGYYNGRQNSSLLPKTFFQPPLVYNTSGLQISIGDANRSVYPNYTNASVLEKIIYPTGGYEEFVWENNFVGSFSGSDTSYRDNLTDNFVHNNPNNNNSNYIQDTTDPVFYFMTDTSFPGVTLSGNIYSRTLTIPPNVKGGIEFIATMTGCAAPFSQNNCHFFFKIVGITNSSFLLNIHEPNFSIKAADMPAGDYKIIAESKTPVDPNQQTGIGSNTATLQVRWSRDPNPDEWIYAGLRIKAINSFDKLTSKAFTKEYAYEYLDPISNTYRSSGRAINFIDVLDENYFTSCSTYMGQGYKLTSGSQVPMEATKGNLVGYTHVTERLNEGLSGYNKYTYSFIDKFPLDPPLDPAFTGVLYVGAYAESFKRRTHCDWLRGNIDTLETYDRYHNQLSSKVYEYEFADRSFIVNHGIETMAYDPYPVDYTVVCPCDRINVNFYSTVTERHRLKNVIEKSFFDGNEVTVSKEYTYNHLSQLKEEKTYDDAGLNIRKGYLYPTDSEMASRPYSAALVLQNRIGIPLVTTTSDASGELSRQETVYKDWSSNLWLPEIIQTSKGGVTTLEPRVKYIQVSTANGNPLEVQQANGTSICYIWGYNYILPVAKIENIAYGNIPSMLINEVINKSNATPYVEADMINALNALRNDPALANTMVTTYTYDPLVGVTSITDPKGDKVTYHYDNFNRLQYVRDKDNNILSENQYHYRTQN